MNYKQMITALGALGLAACANHQSNSPFAKPAASKDVVGSYKNDGSGKYSHFKEFLTINDDSVTLTMICKNSDVGYVVNFLNGESKNKAKVEVTVPARITDGTIEILADAEQYAPEISGRCVAKLQKGVLSYSLNEYQELTVIPQDGLKQTYSKMGVTKPGFFERMDKSFNKAAVGTGAAVVAGAKATGRGVHYAAEQTKNGAFNVAVKTKDTVHAAAESTKNFAVATGAAVKSGLDKADQAVLDAAGATRNGVIFAATKTKDGVHFAAEKAKLGAKAMGEAAKKGVEAMGKNPPVIMF